MMCTTCTRNNHKCQPNVIDTRGQQLLHLSHRKLSVDTRIIKEELMGHKQILGDLLIENERKHAMELEQLRLQYEHKAGIFMVEIERIKTKFDSMINKYEAQIEALETEREVLTHEERSSTAKKNELQQQVLALREEFLKVRAEEKAGKVLKPELEPEKTEPEKTESKTEKIKKIKSKSEKTDKPKSKNRNNVAQPNSDIDD